MQLSEFISMSHHTGKFTGLSDKFDKHLSNLKGYLKKQAASFESEIRSEASDCVKPQGKYLRPLLVFLCAPSRKASDKSLINRAAVAELIHLASLIHDDVIDNADLRRSAETAFKKYGARTAILLGDAIFAHAMQMAFSEKDEVVWRRSIDAVKMLCEGEVRQSLAKDKKIDFDKYISIIEQKTASLFEFACFMGASAECGSGSDWAKAAQKAGKHLGTAYQIYDDICDWTQTEKQSGKTAGTDLVFEKHTLPIILLLEKLPNKQAKILEANLGKSDSKELMALMEKYEVGNECKKVYDKQLALARKILAKHPKTNAGLLEFCDAMQELLP